MRIHREGVDLGHEFVELGLRVLGRESGSESSVVPVRSSSLSLDGSDMVSDSAK